MLSWIGHVCQHNTLPNAENHAIGNGRKGFGVEEDCVTVNRQQGNDGPLTVVTAVHHKTKEVDGHQSQKRHLSEYTNDA